MTICMRYVSQTGQRATPTARITCVARHLYPTRPRFRVHSTVAPRECGIGQFAARVRGKAETCAYITECTCLSEVDFTDSIVKDVLIAGIADLGICREVLGTSAILEKQSMIR